MYRTRLCIGALPETGIPVPEQLHMIKEIGFDGFFTHWDGNNSQYRKIADELGLFYHSIHGPLRCDGDADIASLWRDKENAPRMLRCLIQCLDTCAENRVPIMVSHVFLGYGKTAGPTEYGLNNFKILLDAARKRNVKIAFENSEGEEYLAAVLERFSDDPYAGFCWDTGHELCYSLGSDFASMFGNKMIATHLNDNLGIADYDGTFVPTNDLHLLPFDGAIDWFDAARRLVRCGYDGMLTLEVKKKYHSARHQHDRYERLTPLEFFAEAYARACRIGVYKQNAERSADL